MRYLSVDLETTGLDASTCQVLEVGAILDDLSVQAPFEELPIFQAYVYPKGLVYCGEPFALSMNAEILSRIARRQDGYRYVMYENLAATFGDWLHDQVSGSEITVAGKNYGTFDRDFLECLPEWNNWVKFHRRILDPAPLFFDPKVDELLPDLATCLNRAGLTSTDEHHAVADAWDVCQCLRHKFPI